MVRPHIEVPRERLAELCRHHRILRPALCGSVLRHDFGTASDIDVLIEFDRREPAGFRILRVEEELSRLFGGHKVDIGKPRHLNHRLKDRILNSAQVQYEEG